MVKKEMLSSASTAIQDMPYDKFGVSETGTRKSRSTALMKVWRYLKGEKKKKQAFPIRQQC